MTGTATKMRVYDDGTSKLRSNNSFSDHNCIEIELEITLRKMHQNEEKKTSWKIDGNTNWEIPIQGVPNGSISNN